MLRDEMAAAEDLRGNAPFMRMTTGWGSTDDIVDSMLRGDGVDLEKSPDREVRAASRGVEDLLKTNQAERNAAGLVQFWAAASMLVGELDAAGEAIHPNLAHSSWGVVSNAVEGICKSQAYAPGATGMPDLDTLLALIDRLTKRPFPEHADAPSDSMAWGNWDVRVYAASSTVALAPRFADLRPDIVERMAAFLEDSAPNVRLQVAQALNVRGKSPSRRCGTSFIRSRRERRTKASSGSLSPGRCGGSLAPSRRDATRSWMVF